MLFFASYALSFIVVGTIIRDAERLSDCSLFKMLAIILGCPV